MSWTAIRDQIQTTLSGVSGIGQVHNYLRYVTTQSAFEALFVSGGVINAWLHTRRATDGQRLTNKHTVRRHTWSILGYYALDDSAQSELTFQALLESIEQAFRADVTLTGTAEYVEAIDIIEPVGHVMLPPGDGGFLCHFAELRLVVQERVEE